jgi:hypothetical protein
MKKNEIKLAKSIGKKWGKENTEKFLKTGEIPAVKLSAKEMKYIQGGGIALVN